MVLESLSDVILFLQLRSVGQWVERKLETLVGLYAKRSLVPSCCFLLYVDAGGGVVVILVVDQFRGSVVDSRNSIEVLLVCKCAMMSYRQEATSKRFFVR